VSSIPSVDIRVVVQNQEQIAEISGVSVCAVNNVCTLHNIRAKKRFVDAKTLEQLLRNGLTYDQIATKMGFHRKTIESAVHRFHFKYQPQRGQQQQDKPPANPPRDTINDELFNQECRERAQREKYPVLTAASGYGNW